MFCSCVSLSKNNGGDLFLKRQMIFYFGYSISLGWTNFGKGYGLFCSFVFRYQVMGFSHPLPNLLVRHIVVEADAYPVFAAHVIGGIDRIVASFQYVDFVGVAFDGAGIESVDVEETENFAVCIKHQNGLCGPKCLKRHLLAAVGQGEAKFPEIFDIHTCI